MEYQGRTVIVTGSGSGIGRATAELFASRGARVVAADIDAGAAARTVAALPSSGGAMHLPAEIDVASPTSVRDSLADIFDTVGRVHMLANVAGIYPMAPMIETSDEMWRKVLAVNLDGTFHMCRAVAPHMLHEGGGSIVNVISGAARIPYPGLAAYSASKGGVMAFTRVIAAELAPTIRANCVGPGPTRAADAPAVEDPAFPITMPLGRHGLPEEVAEGIAFLASDRARFITGQILHVNGGRSMH